MLHRKQRQAGIFRVQLGRFGITLPSSMSSGMNINQVLESNVDSIEKRANTFKDVVADGASSTGLRWSRASLCPSGMSKMNGTLPLMKGLWRKGVYHCGEQNKRKKATRRVYQVSKMPRNGITSEFNFAINWRRSTFPWDPVPG
jgi:hypothetical protein